MPTPVVVDSITTTEVPVSYAAIPATLTRVPLPKVTTVIGTPTLDADGRPEPAYADAQVTYRDLVNVWGSLRLVVGGKDVTFLRNVSAQVGGYQLQEPYGFGPADFAFPQLSNLEVDLWGTGALSWFDIGKPVRLVQVDKDLHAVKVLWKGFISALNPTKDGTAVHCDGDASGKLALRDKHPALFVFTKDIGVWMFDAFRNCSLALTPYLGAKTGIRVDSRGRSGTYLSYTDGLLAEAMELDGDQWTVMPHPTQAGRYKMRLKDRTTIHATAFNGANGVEVDVSRDLSEEPTTIYGSGVGPDGQVWVNGRYPGLKQADPPAFPGTLSEGDSGDDVIVLKSKLAGMGYLDREDAEGDVFTDDVTDAVKDLQDDRNLTQNGVVNSATWDAAFDVSTTTRLSLANAAPMPLAQDPRVRKWNRTANGSLAGRNPRYDPKAIEVDLTVDHGAGTPKKRARKWSKRKLAQIQNGKNWVGTITLTADVAAGDVIATDAITPMSRLDLTAGMNIKVRHFDYVTTFHVSGVNVDSDLTVRLAVDTKARDLMTLGQIIERNRASRINPARQWSRQHRGTDANHAQVQWSEVGGEIFTKVTCPGGDWTVFPVIGGQAGTIDRIRLLTSDVKTEFVVAVLAKKVTAKWMRFHVTGNPFDVHSPVTGISLDAGGSGYTSAPAVSLSGGGGSGAKATAVIKNGAVVDVNLTKSGNGYTSAPSVSLSGGGGSGAGATAHIRTGSAVWQSADIRDAIDAKRVLLWAWGDAQQPGGYWPGLHTADDGTTTGDPLTGKLLDAAGVPYHTFGQPVLYVAFFPRNSCELDPQRIMWPVLEAGS